MDEHKKFLADRLLSEERPITYRLLSRALDVHVNTAKEMLYDFYNYQNKQKADSVHATYLIYGIKAVRDSQKGGDTEMTSSMPEQEPLSEDVPTTTMAIVREEDLVDTLALYKVIESIHVYSIAPYTQKDLTLLSDVSKSLTEYRKDGDGLPGLQKYGTITNSHVRRRDRTARHNPPSAIAATSKPAVKAEASTAKITAPAAKVKQEAANADSKDSTPASSAGKPSAPATLKRGGSGSIMQSFAKAKTVKQKAPAEKEEADAMALSDDGEADDSDLPQPKKKEPEDSDAVRKSRREREAELRRMMEEDDDEDEAEAAGKEEEEDEAEQEDEEMAEAPEPEAETEPSDQPEEKKTPAEVVQSSGDGRRRGKRRVMKKKRIMDDEGYMVTIQEEGWESFSEEDAPPPSKKPATATSTPSSSNPKAKKPAGKPGQGNIMSFFSKK